METPQLYKITVKGHVQGVGFRWSAASEARNRDIRGFVSNLSDGSVYIEAEGNPVQLDIFLEWCRKGPAFSTVDSVDVEKAAPVLYNDFKIR